MRCVFNNEEEKRLVRRRKQSRNIRREDDCGYQAGPVKTIYSASHGKDEREMAKTQRETTIVTPRVAAEWLKQNTANRQINTPMYTRLARTMRDGLWKYNGDAIRFDYNGVLLDGQHRLLACVESGVSFETDVVFGLAPDVMPTIDINKARTSSNIADIYGIQNPGLSCSLARLLFIHRTKGIQKMNVAMVQPTKQEVVNLVMQEPRISETAKLSTVWGTPFGYSGMNVFCYYLFSEQNETLAKSFFEKLRSGANLSKSSPIYLLRERLRRNKDERAKLSRLDVLAIIFKAWIAYRDNKTIGMLRWRPDESFPDISLPENRVILSKARSAGR